MGADFDVRRFYADVMLELGEHARRGGTATGAAVVVKRVARAHGLQVAEEVALPRLSVAEMEELGVRHRTKRWL
jgi:hypothetical protein